MKSQIRSFIREQLLDGQEIGDDENLLLSGLVDSIGIMRLVMFIEQDLHVTVPPEDVTIENFVTLDDMARYLKGREP